MMPGLWVSMPIIRNIVAGTGCNSREVEMICRAGGISPEQLEDADFKVSLEQNCAIMEAALTISGNKNLGLHTGEKTTAVVLGITGHLMQSSRDVLTALQNLQQFTTVFTRLYNFSIEIRQAEVYYYCEPLEVWNDISPETARQSVDIAYAGAIHVVYLLTGRKIYPQKVLYRYKRTADTSEYARVFKCQPLFNQACNCMVFALADMQIPVIGYNKELNQIFKQLLEAEIQKQGAESQFTSQVKQTILKHFQFHFPPLEEVAAHMHLTTRTLQRKLKDENTTFRILTDSIKQELACNLLGNKNLSVSEIAYKLGYAEPSTFQRAFRQWTGKSPNAFRHQSE
ncbi:MAG: AraC family transcriptional regulator [Lewinellaceae bacterium]|nr:AraC family transcriptional regulator [Lewinellaceae bacterium]